MIKKVEKEMNGMLERSEKIWDSLQRGLTRIEDECGEIWWHGEEVCERLGFSDPNEGLDSVEFYCKKRHSMSSDEPSVIFINDLGFADLSLVSEIPECRELDKISEEIRLGLQSQDH